MWPLSPLSPHCIGITITQNYLLCSWVEEVSSSLHLKGYAKQPLCTYEVIDGVLYNISALIMHIQKFIKTYNLEHTYSIIDFEKSIDTPPKELIMQFQLLALRIPLNCIMITSYVQKNMLPTKDSLCDQPTLHELEPYEAEYIVHLYKIGKGLL